MKKIMLGIIALGIVCIILFGMMNVSEAANMGGSSGKAMRKPVNLIVNTPRTKKTLKNNDRNQKRTIIIIQED